MLECASDNEAGQKIQAKAVCKSKPKQCANACKSSVQIQAKSSLQIHAKKQCTSKQKEVRESKPR
jgi:hypothetical protein